MNKLRWMPCLLLVALLFSMAFAATSFGRNDDAINVISTGRGISVVEARKNAIMNALREVVGEYIESETVMLNEQIVTDAINAFSNAESVRSTLISRRLEGDEIIVECEVTIVPTKIIGRVRSAIESLEEIDGESLAAELLAMKDNIEAQKPVLDRLFSGLSAKLLWARLVDRKGGAIEGGRIPKDDIMISGNEVTFALNIQVGYDLDLYDERVYPELKKVLSAVALKVLPNEASSKPLIRGLPTFSDPYVTKQAFTNDPAALREWQLRSNALGEGKSYTWTINVEPRKFAVFLSAARRRNGLQETFDAFILPSELSSTIMNWNHVGSTRDKVNKSTLPRMEVLLESEGGDILDRQFVSLAGNASGGIRGRDTVVGVDEQIPFPEPFWRIDGELQTWMFRGNNIGWRDDLRARGGGGAQGNYPLVISPSFGWQPSSSSWHQLEFGKTILVRTYISMTIQDFEKLATIRFDFWDPRVDR